MADTLLRTALTFLPEGVALIVGLVLAVLRRRTDPQLAGLVAAGLSLHLVAVVLGTVSVVVGSGLRTAADLERYAQLGGVLGLVVIFTRLLGWILLLFALFRRLPRTGARRDTTPTGRHALLDAQGEQVIAEEGQSLYPDDDALTPGRGLVAAGAVGAGAGYLGGRAFGDDPYGDGAYGGRPDGGGPYGVQPPGSDAPTVAVPISRLRELEAEELEPEEPGPEEPSDEEVDEQDVHDPVEDEIPDPQDEIPGDETPDDETPDDAGPVDVPVGAPGRPTWPGPTSTPVLRTAYADEDAWETARTAIVGPDDVDAPTNLEVVDDPGFADLTTAEIEDLAAGDDVGDHPCLFVVDATTTSEPGSPVLVVGMRAGSGRTFRCAASEVQTVETSLSVAGSFERFADAAAASDDGVFRGL